MTTKSVEAMVQELADREEIHQLPAKYCHYIMQGNLDGVVNLFTPDAEFGGGQPPLRGHDDLRRALAQSMNPHRWPMIHNHVIESLDGDRATGTAYYELRGAQDGKSMLGAGVYKDEYVRTPDGWRIHRRNASMGFYAPLSVGWAEQAAQQA